MTEPNKQQIVQSIESIRDRAGDVALTCARGSFRQIGERLLVIVEQVQGIVDSIMGQAAPISQATPAVARVAASSVAKRPNQVTYTIDEAGNLFKKVVLVNEGNRFYQHKVSKDRFSRVVDILESMATDQPKPTYSRVIQKQQRKNHPFDPLVPAMNYDVSIAFLIHVGVIKEVDSQFRLFPNFGVKAMTAYRKFARECKSGKLDPEQQQKEQDSRRLQNSVLLEKLHSSESDQAFWRQMRSDRNLLEYWLQQPFVTGKEASPAPAQTVHTPAALCDSIVEKALQELEVNGSSRGGCKFLAYNLEFVISLINHKIRPEQIWLSTDNFIKARMGERLYNRLNVQEIDFLQLGEEFLKSFDCIFLNPPYQADADRSGENGKGGRETVWQDYVEVMVSALIPGGILCAIHPPRWRKPKDATGDLLRKYDMLYLEMYDREGGFKVFGKQTRFDWYVLQKTMTGRETEVVFVDGSVKPVRIRDWPFIPNCDFDFIMSLVAKAGEEKCEFLYSYSAYEERKPWMSPKETATHCHPCIHSTGKRKTRIYYSSRTDRGMFGVKKVIFGDSAADGIHNPVIDDEGKYGQTQHAIGLVGKTKSEVRELAKAITSPGFKERFLRACGWTNFEIEHETFLYLRRDFWRSFLPK